MRQSDDDKFSWGRPCDSMAFSTYVLEASIEPMVYIELADHRVQATLSQFDQCSMATVSIRHVSGTFL